MLISHLQNIEADNSENAISALKISKLLLEEYYDLSQTNSFKTLKSKEAVYLSNINYSLIDRDKKIKLSDLISYDSNHDVMSMRFFDESLKVQYFDVYRDDTRLSSDSKSKAVKDLLIDYRMDFERLRHLHLYDYPEVYGKQEVNLKSTNSFLRAEINFVKIVLFTGNPKFKDWSLSYFLPKDEFLFKNSKFENGALAIFNRVSFNQEEVEKQLIKK